MYSTYQTLISAVQLDDNPTSYTSAAVKTDEYDDLTIHISLTKTLAPTNVTLTVETSPDNSTWYDFDRLYTITDPIPVVNVVYTATGTDLIVIKDFTRYTRLKVVATGTDGTNYFTVTAQLAGRIRDKKE
jgi:hypothetical protein